RRERGGLWDVGPHALSLVLPVLGPVDRVAAMAGPRDEVHLLLGHSGGAASTVSLAVDAPPAATAGEFVFFGEPGVFAAPDGDGTPVEAFGRAIGRLVAGAAGGAADPCDVGFARDVVAVLAAAEAARRDGVTVRL
ncbi:MAG TPA: gfo/Idh/MocA family oxidoreductase, partial [Pilimelia sp.]|nr:gfo/Idh/MocA family oxidoreductase [Pilimelia sp.]